MMAAPSRVIKWLHNYFSNVLQLVCAKSKESGAAYNNTEVLHSSVLCPFTILLYTHPPNVMQTTSLFEWVDDMAMLHQLKKVADLVAIENAARCVFDRSNSNI